MSLKNKFLFSTLALIPTASVLAISSCGTILDDQKKPEEAKKPSIYEKNSTIKWTGSKIILELRGTNLPVAGEPQFSFRVSVDGTKFNSLPLTKLRGDATSAIYSGSYSGATPKLIQIYLGDELIKEMSITDESTSKPTDPEQKPTIDENKSSAKYDGTNITLELSGTNFPTTGDDFSFKISTNGTDFSDITLTKEKGTATSATFKGAHTGNVPTKIKIMLKTELIKELSITDESPSKPTEPPEPSEPTDPAVPTISNSSKAEWNEDKIKLTIEGTNLPKDDKTKYSFKENNTIVQNLNFEIQTTPAATTEKVVLMVSGNNISDLSNKTIKLVVDKTEADLQIPQKPTTTPPQPQPNQPKFTSASISKNGNTIRISISGERLESISDYTTIFVKKTDSTQEYNGFSLSEEDGPPNQIVLTKVDSNNTFTPGQYKIYIKDVTGITATLASKQTFPRRE